jgi:hypothetical protein
MKGNGPDKQMKANPFAICLLCHLEFSEQPKGDPAIPLELIVLPSNALLLT